HHSVSMTSTEETPCITRCTQLPGIGVRPELVHSVSALADDMDFLRMVQATSREVRDDDRLDSPIGLVTQVSMASLGDNTAMVVATMHAMGDWQTWSIMSVHHDHSVTFTPIPGPPNPEGVYKTQIERIGGSIVAYGGLLGRHPERPAWLMAVYSIDSGEWESVPYIEGYSPVPTIMHAIGCKGDSFLVSQGLSGLTGTRDWTEDMEWSVNTREWSSSTFECSGERSALWEVSDSDDGKAVNVALYGNHRICVSQGCHSATDGVSGFVRCWILDAVSQDVEVVGALNIPEPKRNSRGEITSLANSAALLMNPSTLVIVGGNAILVVDIDPHYLGPEYHTSMGGCQPVGVPREISLDMVQMLQRAF
ncbi:hypothetical protein KIPB_013610, partial [Kipferlia bialata]